MTAETFDAVLADVMGTLVIEDRHFDRLAAAHASEVAEVRGWNERVSVCRDHTDEIVDGDCVVCRAEAAESRAEAATALLRECLPYIEGHAQASHLTDGFKRRPNNAHDDLAARVAGMVGRE